MPPPSRPTQTRRHRVKRGGRASLRFSLVDRPRGLDFLLSAATKQARLACGWDPGVAQTARLGRPRPTGRASQNKLSMSPWVGGLSIVPFVRIVDRNRRFIFSCLLFFFRSILFVTVLGSFRRLSGSFGVCLSPTAPWCFFCSSLSNALFKSLEFARFERRRRVCVSPGRTTSSQPKISRFDSAWWWPGDR